VQDFDGVAVEDLNLGYSIIRTWDDNVNIVQNSVMVSQAILKSAE